VRSEGVYKSLVCGTGKVMSTRNVLESQTFVFGEPKTNFAALVRLLKYTVELVAGQGALYWHSPAVHKVATGKPLSGLGPIDPKPHDAKDYGLGGFVEILLDATKETAPCTKAVQATGLLTVDTEDPL
jgi:hypothetical protein